MAHPEKAVARKTLVLGLGNTLLCDEGSGVHAVRAMRERYRGLRNVEYLDGGTLSFTLAPPIEDADHLIVFDAAQLNAPAGTVCVFLDEEMDRFLASNKKCSVHEVSLIDLMAIAHLTGHLPRHRALIGIQPQSLDWGDAPTDAVSAAIPEALGLAAGLIERWHT